jgi:hypothetical protein
VLPKRPRPPAMPYRSSTSLSTNRAASRRPSGANSSIRLRQGYGGPSGRFAHTLPCPP